MFSFIDSISDNSQLDLGIILKNADEQSVLIAFLLFKTV